MDANQNFHVFNRTELDNYDHNETIRLYDAWKEEDKAGITHGPAWDTYVCHLIGLLHFFVEHRITAKKRFLGAEKEDLVESGRLAIIAMAHKYDPRKAKPTSYFSRYIDQYTKECVKDYDNKGLTQHYMGALGKLDRTAKEYGFSGIDDESLSLEMLADISDVPLTTIREVRKMKEQQCVSLDLFENNYADSDYATPEKKFLQQEQSDILYGVFSKLTPLQQWLLRMIDIHGTPMSDVMNLLKTPDIFAEFEEYIGDVKHINQVFIKKQRGKALRMLRSNYTFKKYTSYEESKYDLEMEPQATYEDIENAINANILDLD